jgi:hypothetical protein
VKSVQKNKNFWRTEKNSHGNKTNEKFRESSIPCAIILSGGPAANLGAVTPSSEGVTADDGIAANR